MQFGSKLKSTVQFLFKVRRRLEQSYVKFLSEKLADSTSSSIKIHVRKQPSVGNKLRTYTLNVS